MKKCTACKQEKDIKMQFISRYGKDTVQCLDCRNYKYKFAVKCIECKISTPNFNYPSEKIGIYCYKCHKVGMINVVVKKCVKCKIVTPSYNLENVKTPKYCVSCKSDNMVDITRKRCIECNKGTPFFNYIDENPLYCSTCRKDNMVDVISKKCISCNKHQPSFNLPGEIKPLYCTSCKSNDMVDIANKKCIGKCGKIPHYNFPNERKPLYCTSCKIDGMIDLYKRLCKGCNKSAPSFNYKEEDVPEYCALCKNNDMINITRKHCIECNNTPSYNYPTESILLYCASCKKDGMINIKMIRCDKCKTRASYGIPSYKPSRCTKHKEENMILKPRKQCTTDNCKELAIYGKGEPNHCEDHKEEDEINLIYRKCVKCGDIELLDKDNLCTLKCSLVQDIYKRRQQVKQHEVTKFLETRLTEKTIDINDAILDNACTKQRPDIGYDCETHYVFIEVDENQHRYSKGYEAPCEVSRMIKLALSCGGKGAIFIRYNPDAFRDNDGKVCKVPKAPRQDNLLRWVRHCLQSAPENKQDFLRIIYLYYDAYDQAKEKLINLDLSNYSKEEMIESGIKVDVLDKLLEV